MRAYLFTVALFDADEIAHNGKGEAVYLVQSAPLQRGRKISAVVVDPGEGDPQVQAFTDKREAREAWLSLVTKGKG